MKHKYEFHKLICEEVENFIKNNTPIKASTHLDDYYSHYLNYRRYDIVNNIIEKNSNIYGYNTYNGSCIFINYNYAFLRYLNFKNLIDVYNHITKFISDYIHLKLDKKYKDIKLYNIRNNYRYHFIYGDYIIYTAYNDGNINPDNIIKDEILNDYLSMNSITNLIGGIKLFDIMPDIICLTSKKYNNHKFLINIGGNIFNSFKNSTICNEFNKYIVEFNNYAALGKVINLTFEELAKIYFYESQYKSLVNSLTKLNNSSEQMDINVDSIDKMITEFNFLNINNSKKIELIKFGTPICAVTY